MSAVELSVGKGEEAEKDEEEEEEEEINNHLNTVPNSFGPYLPFLQARFKKNENTLQKLRTDSTHAYSEAGSTKEPNTIRVNQLFS